jgi:glutamate-ammonia-ligase adenylyltransferase
MRISLDTLFSTAPYLSALHDRHGAWFDAAMAAPDAALAAELARLGEEGARAAGEDELGRALRVGKGRIALLAAAAECLGLWSTAQATAALSDLADAALEAGLDLLIRQARDKGQIEGNAVDSVGPSPASTAPSPESIN